MAATRIRLASALTYLSITYVAVIFFQLVFRLEPILQPIVLVPYVSVGLFAAAIGWLIAPWNLAQKTSVKLYVAPLLVIIGASLCAGLAFSVASWVTDELPPPASEVVFSGFFVAYFYVVGASPVLLICTLIGIFILRSRLLRYNS